MAEKDWKEIGRDIWKNKTGDKAIIIEQVSNPNKETRYKTTILTRRIGEKDISKKFPSNIRARVYAKRYIRNND